MRILTRCCLGLGILAAGYLLGASGAFSTAGAKAQQPADSAPSDETIDKIREANNAMNAAMLALMNDGRYKSVIQDPNAFLIMSGGGDAMADLESGRGVDPVTFAALYSGRAIGDIQGDLSEDEEGRLTYKNKLVRMYSKGRLAQTYEIRARILGEEKDK